MSKPILTVALQTSTPQSVEVPETLASSYEDCTFCLLQRAVTKAQQLKHKTQLFYHLARRFYHHPSGEVVFPLAITCQIEQGDWNAAIAELQAARLLAVRSLIH